MNIAYFLLPKHSVAYLYDDCTFRQGLEKMRHHGYTAIPVISRDGKYVGTVSEGDFLWQLLSKDCETLTAYSMKDMERLQVRDILRGNSYPPVRITVTMEELLHSAMNQNFIPVVDDLGNFTGSSPEKTSSATLRSRRMRRSRCLCGRSYKPTGRRRGTAPPPFFSPAFIPSYHPGSICAPGLAGPRPGGHSRHIARKGVQKIESLPRLERGLRRQHGPHAGAAALGPGPPAGPSSGRRPVPWSHPPDAAWPGSLTGRMCSISTPTGSPDRATSTAPVVWLRLKWTSGKSGK